MKKVLAIIAAIGISGAALSCYAEGTLGLENFSSNPVYYLANTTPAPVTYAGGDMTWILVSANGAALGQPFNLVMDGYFDNGLGYVAGTADSANVDVTIQAWKGAAASTFAGAQESATASWNQASGKNPGAPSPPIPEALKVPGNFIISAIPEPSTIALVLLGGAALLLRRRK